MTVVFILMEIFLAISKFAPFTVNMVPGTNIAEDGSTLYASGGSSFKEINRFTVCKLFINVKLNNV